MKDDDIIRSVLRLAWSVSTGVDMRTREQIELQARQQWGGARPYVPKEPAAGKVCRMAAELAAGRPIGEAFEAAGVRKSFGYALLSRRLCRR